VKDLWRSDISPKASPDKRADLQCLGEMPWVSRATAIKPDPTYMGPTMPGVKGVCIAIDPKRT